MDWGKAPEELVSHIAREGEKYLEGQLKLATSADQRAAVLAGIFAAAATAVLVGIISLSLVTNITISHSYPIYLGGGAMAIMFLAAASLCIAAVMPVGFWLPGNEPESWYSDIEQGKPLNDSLCEEIEHIQSKIEENRTTLEGNARKFKWGSRIGIASPFVGSSLWFIASSSWWISRLASMAWFG